MHTPLLIIDRDGTIIEDVPYLSDPSKIVYFSSVIAALDLLKCYQFKIAIATNQSGIGRMLITENEHLAVKNKIMRQLDGIVDHYEFCPHIPEDNCNCRKPKTGMYESIMKRFNVTPLSTMVIGNNQTDIEPALTLGCNSRFLIDDPYKFWGQFIENIDVHLNKFYDVIDASLT